MAPGRQIAFYWGVVALLCLALSPLATDLVAGLPGCPVKTISGLPCPSCGATRATLALAQFEPGRALAANPLVTLAWALLIGGGLVALGAAVRGVDLPRLPRRLPLAARLVAVGVVIANWVYLVGSGT